MKHLIQEAEAEDKESSLAGIGSTVYVVSRLYTYVNMCIQYILVFKTKILNLGVGIDYCYKK